MARRTYSGLEVSKVLVRWGFEPTGGRGSHRTFRYEHPETDEVRTVTVPLHEELDEGTLREIADEAGANDFDAFCAEIEEWL